MDSLKSIIIALVIGLVIIVIAVALLPNPNSDVAQQCLTLAFDGCKATFGIK